MKKVLIYFVCIKMNYLRDLILGIQPLSREQSKPWCLKTAICYWLQTTESISQNKLFEASIVMMITTFSAACSHDQSNSIFFCKPCHVCTEIQEKINKYDASTTESDKMLKWERSVNLPLGERKHAVQKRLLVDLSQNMSSHCAI